MKKRSKKDYSEEDFASVVVEYLSDLGWEVYQEVDHKVGVADIVATKNQLVWVVEAKKSLGLPVIAQAYRWRWYAHYTSVAVPKGKHRDSTYGLASRILKGYGLGLLEVNYYNRYVEPTHLPSLMRKALAKDMLAGLTEEHKYYAKAGTKSGKHLTKWGGTRDKLVSYVFSHPGCTLKAALSSIKHHYHSDVSAQRSMASLIRSNAIPSIRAAVSEVPSTKGKTPRPDNLKNRHAPTAMCLFPVEYTATPTPPEGAKIVGFWGKHETPELYTLPTRNRLHLHRYIGAATTYCSLGSGIIVCPICKEAIPYSQLTTQDGKWAFPSTLMHLLAYHHVAPPVPEFLMDATDWYLAAQEKKNSSHP